MTENLDHDGLCRTIVEDSPLAILFADRDGRIRLWNAGAEALFGFTADEALGKSMDLIIPERQRARHWEGWERVMASGITRYGRDALAVPATRKDGSRISIEFNILLVRTRAGEILGAAALIRDVTARWQREKEMKARLAVLEAREKES
jgi:PAS domain S-box-containing protein